MDIVAQISQRLNLGLAESRIADARRIICEWCKQENIQTITDFELALSSHPLNVQQLVNTLVIGETYFFRHKGHFAFIRQELLRDTYVKTKHYEVLSAGCSTGEEAYSSAMLFQQTGVRYTVTGLDISSDNIRDAKKGIYSSWSLRNIKAFPELAIYFREYKKGR